MEREQTAQNAVWTSSHRRTQGKLILQLSLYLVKYFFFFVGGCGVVFSISFIHREYIFVITNLLTTQSINLASFIFFRRHLTH